MKFTHVLLVIIGFLLTSCKGKVNPNEWVVVTSTCWNEMTVKEAGDIVPRLYTACDRMVVLPATELSAEFKTETKFDKRLAGTVELSYQWRIIDPIRFIKSAKSITSSSTSSYGKVDPNELESIENAVVDKMIINLLREYTPSVDPGNINELEIEKSLQILSDKGTTERGIQFTNFSVNVNLSPQAEEALDVLSALNFYIENNEEELGRRIIEAKAGSIRIGATHIYNSGQNK